MLPNQKLSPIPQVTGKLTDWGRTYTSSEEHFHLLFPQAVLSLPSLKPTTKISPEWQHLWGGVYRDTHRSFGETICKRRFRFAQLTSSEVGMVISSREVCSQGCPIWWYWTRVPLIWQLPGMLSWTCRSYSAFSWGPQTLILQWHSKHIQHYLRLPHCVISSICSLRHRCCSRPSLQELSPHALEVASRLVSGPHGSCPANAADIPARVVICSYGSWAPIPLCPCHIRSSTRASSSHPSRREEQLSPSEILTKKLSSSQFASIKGKERLLWYYVFHFRATSSLPASSGTCVSGTLHAWR